MGLPNIYTRAIADKMISRIEMLNPESQKKWGKMDVSSMLAHCCITYEYIFNERDDKPNFLMKFILKNFIKGIVVGEKEYKQNIGTAPAFIITEKRDFNVEKSRLLNYINRVVSEGDASFQDKVSSSFGKLTANEWNNMMYKHLDHHLRQFGV